MKCLHALPVQSLGMSVHLGSDLRFNSIWVIGVRNNPCLTLECHCRPLWLRRELPDLHAHAGGAGSNWKQGVHSCKLLPLGCDVLYLRSYIAWLVGSSIKGMESLVCAPMFGICSVSVLTAV